MAYRYSLIEEPTSGNQSLLISTEEQPAAQTSQSSLLDKKADFNILEKLKFLRDSRKFCDVVLEVRGVKFVAHKNVLASWSPTFASKLFSDDPKVFKDYIHVFYDNCEVFSDLLDFMYNGYVAPRETNFLQLLHLAVSFQIETLKNYCEEFLRCNLHLGNFVSTYFLSRKFKLETLEEYIVGFLQLNLSDAVKQGEFLSLRAEKFNTFLSEGWMKKIKPEIKLFLIISWVGYDVQEREKYLVHLLGHINWSTVANDFLLEINRTENFFTSHESSLYLLLQTLYSAGIALGPYKEVFPTLRETHSAILKEVVHTSLLRVDTEEFCPVGIEVRPRPVLKDEAENTDLSIQNDMVDTAVNTDVNSKHFEETKEVHTHHSSHVQGKKVDAEVTKTPDIRYDQFETLGEFIEAEIHEIKQREHQERQAKEKETVTEHKNNVEPPALIVTSPENKTPPPPKNKAKRKSSSVTKSADISTPVSEPKQSQTPQPTRQSRRNPKRARQEDYEYVLDLEVENFDETAVVNKKSKEQIIESTYEESASESGEEMDEKNKAIASKIKSGSKKKVKGRKSKAGESENEAGKSIMCTYEDCAYITKFQQRMDKHIKMAHEATFELKCNLCQFETKEVRKFHSHMKTHFTGPPFKCDYPRCTFSAEKIKVMISHRCTHTDERPFTCDCGMRFRTNNTLIAHKKVHLGKKEHTCTECGISFATQNTLNQHRVVHFDIRPYLCHLCGFSTKFQSHLIAHKRIHTGEVFHCQFPNCNYFSPKRSQLKAHMRAHLGIRAHVCEICSKSFVEKSHLVRHQKLHADVRIACEECDYTTTRKDKLKEHVKKHHTGDAPNKPKKPPSTKKKPVKARNNKPDTAASDSVQSEPELPAPMIVKWDHGAYSLSQEQQESVATPSGDTLLNGDGDYCVLRDTLNSGEPMQHMLVEPLNGQMSAAKSLDTSAQAGGILADTVTINDSLSQAQAVTGMGTSVPVLSLLNSPISTVDPGAVGQKLDTSEAGHHTYTIIQTASGEEGQQQEYGGLNAFMAFI